MPDELPCFGETHDTTPDLSVLIASLHHPACYDHPVEAVRVIETHISYVLLTGEFAYKIKKPLDLGFLDFSTLSKRLHACCDEVQLNRRFAPDLYLDVVPISGEVGSPRVNGNTDTLEYAVKMAQFPLDATLDRLDARGELTAQHIEAIAVTLARFQSTQAPRAAPGSPWGKPDVILSPIQQNFAQIAAHLDDAEDRQMLDVLKVWSETEHARLLPLMQARAHDGHIREGHGDLHLGNLAWVAEQLLVFDCIEFNPALRWIDIQSEAAFCYMDLLQRGHAAWGWLFLNRWLEETGDYEGLPLLRYYAVYRALVRAKVAAFRSSQTGAPKGAALRAQLQFALTLIRPLPLHLDITHGLSGAGKTTLTQALMQQPGAIRLRSDVERKRLAGLAATDSSHSAPGQGLYTMDATRALYQRLADLGRAALHAGWPVIVDATFTARWQRDLLRQVAASQGVAFRILDFDIPVATLQERIARRLQIGGDASEADSAVLQQQLATQEPLAADEMVYRVEIAFPLGADGLLET